ncbi:MAG: glycosyl hydrolase [Verrucomicrobiae bacterium]|nr:glycosyl hydrolase [Verrucomicrobiae bacterium]
MLCWLACFLFPAIVFSAAEVQTGDGKVLPRMGLPPPGRIYHGVYPGGITGDEDDLTPNDLAVYQKLAGQPAAWVYFSHNWFNGRGFPLATARWIRDAGAVPYIRLMLRSQGFADEPQADPVYTLKAILSGQFDRDLREWGKRAGEFGSPLIVEYGTEVNGEWFVWNGRWNGKAKGPGRFRAAYRRIIRIMREAGASNITWVFHVDDSQIPPDGWNRFENYYPGDDYIDWLAASIYGPQKPDGPYEEGREFAQMLDEVYPRLLKMAPGKPVVVAEFGCTAGHPNTDCAVWTEKALKTLFGGRWPKVMGFSWWNERWKNGGGQRDTTMRLQDIPPLTGVFRDALSDNASRLQTRPVIVP